MAPIPTRPQLQRRTSARSRRFARALALAIAAASGTAASGTAAPASGASSTAGGDRPTILDPIEAVLVEGAALEPPAEGTLSIPLTRIDVVVDNGVAITRLVQTYHNHGEESTGFAFSLPLSPDTTISQLNLWDRGERLVGVLADRQRAEKVYRRVTGDETPSLARDPALARRSGDRFDLRIFPIVPGETKQVELWSHRRLGLGDGDALRLDLPLSQLCGSQDPRHPTTRSQRLELSVVLQDELPIHSWRSSPPLEEVERQPHRIALRRSVTLEESAADLELAFQLTLGDRQQVATTRALREDGAVVFSTRVLYRPPPPAAPSKEPALPADHPDSLYLGVWHGPNNDRPMSPDALRLEAVAFFTFAILPPSVSVHVSWQPPALDLTPQEELVYGRGYLSEMPVRAGIRESEIGGLIKATVRSPGPPPGPADVLDHLAGALASGFRWVVLLLDERWSADLRTDLEQLLASYPGATVLLVTEHPFQETWTPLPNVRHLVLGDGWSGGPPTGRRQLLEVGSWAPLGYLSLGFRDLAALWEVLPWRSSALASITSTGPGVVAEPHLLTQPGEPGGKLGLLWLSGLAKASAPLELALELPRLDSGLEGLLEPADDPTPLLLSVPLDVGSASADLQWIGSLWARQETDRLVNRRRALEALAQPLNRGDAQDAGPIAAAETATRISAVRRRIVELSRRYSFLTDETAFLALPEDLRRATRLRRQQLGAQRLYNLSGMKEGGTPEPAEWALLTLGALLALAFALRR